MRIVLASSEAVPFSKTGGLADVASALSKALAHLGHDVWLVLPYHRQIWPRHLPRPQSLDAWVDIPVGNRQVAGELLTADLDGSPVQVVLVDQPRYFDRPALYTQNGEDYRDNCERFVFFSRAVLETARQLDVHPEVVHVNDWQTGLVPALLQIEYRGVPGFEHTGSVMTVHNMAFHGQFWKWDMQLTGLDWRYFNWRQMEYFDHLNLLKTGIVFADTITTVSPTYAREIQTEGSGCGLHGVLTARRSDLVGILNGIDPSVWDPANDPHLVKNYSLATDGISDVVAAKAANKAALQKAHGLPVRREIPLLSMISRLTDQKGLDLISGCARQALQRDLQFLFLGTGNERYENLLRELSAEFPDKVAAVIGFDEALAHRIEAGSDIYLMPSRFEPCGLNQMYSLQYGTVPIARRVGGLADSVVDTTEDNLRAGTANGFTFDRYESEELLAQIRRAVDTYGDRETWKQLIKNGMSRDWSWDHSASEYLSVYRRAAARHAEVPAHAH